MLSDCKKDTKIFNSTKIKYPDSTIKPQQNLTKLNHPSRKHVWQLKLEIQILEA